MTWLARLKKQKTTGTYPTAPTKPGFVGFVGTPAGHIRNFEGDAPAANDPAPYPDRWCWPHSLAMNGEEIDIFAVRLAKFKARGLSGVDGEALADKLVLRDREQDDRRVCLECQHLAGYGAGSWRCSNWQTAEIAMCLRDAQLAADLVVQLQRCAGFGALLGSTP